MSVSLKGKSLIALKDYSVEEVRYLLDLSHKVKEQKRNGELHERFRGKSIALLFEKTIDQDPMRL